MRNPLNAILVASLVAAGLLACEGQESDPASGRGPEPKPAALAAAADTTARAPSYVPDSSVFFVGSLETLALQPGLDIFAKQTPGLASEEWQKLLAEGAKTPGTPGGRLLMALNVEYMAAAVKPDQFKAALGIADPIDIAFYAIGAVPVLRVAVGDPDAFWGFVDRAQVKAGVEGAAKTLDGATYRTYRLSDEGAPETQVLDLVVGVHEGFAVFTLASAALDAETLALSLGTRKPEKSLAASGRLEATAKAHGFLPMMVGYIDHRLLVEGLADPAAGSLGTMLQKLAAGPDSEFPAVIDLLRTPACRQEFAAIAELWPQTLVGYTEYDLDKAPYRIGSRLVFESKDEALLADLSSLVGEIPVIGETGSQAPLYTMGLGLRVDALMPFVMSTRSRLLEASYECEPLQAAHSALVEVNPAIGVGMVTGLAAGVSGISATVLDLALAVPDATQPGQGQPGLERIDLVAAVSVQDPATFLAKLLAMAPPPYSEISVPADGSPVEIPLPPMPNSPVQAVKIAAKGDKILVFVGARAEQVVDQMAKSGAATKGLLHVGMNYAKYFELMGSLLGSIEPGVSPEEAAIFENLKGFDAQLDMALKVEDKGIVFDSDMWIGKP